jgi:hypothetical protein
MIEMDATEPLTIKFCKPVKGRAGQSLMINGDEYHYVEKTEAGHVWRCEVEGVVRLFTMNEEECTLSEPFLN